MYCCLPVHAAPTPSNLLDTLFLHFFWGGGGLHGELGFLVVGAGNDATQARKEAWNEVKETLHFIILESQAQCHCTFRTISMSRLVCERSFQDHVLCLVRIEHDLFDILQALQFQSSCKC